MTKDVIEQESIFLKPIDSTYTDLIVKWRNSDLVRTNFIFRETITNEMHENWLKTKVETGSVVQFVVHDSLTKKPVGSVYLRDIDNDNHSAEFGIFIGDSNFIGKGLGTQATRAIVEYGFKKMNLHRISLRLLAENTRAKNTYLKVGFKEEGTFKDMVFVDGKYLDIVFMAIINEEEKI